MFKTLLSTRFLAVMMLSGLSVAAVSAKQSEAKKIAWPPEDSPVLMQNVPTASVSQQEAAVSRAASKTTSKAATSAQQFVGSYRSIDKSYYNTDADINRKVEIKEDGGVYKVNYLFNIDNPLPLTWNAGEGTLELTPQVLFQHETYGPCTVNSIDVVNGKPVMNTTRPIVFSLNSDGSISMSPWGAFVQTGPYKGGTFDAFYLSTLHKPNARISYTPFAASADETPETQSYEGLIYQNDDASFIIGNFLNTGKSFSVSITGKGEGVITPQFVMNQNLFGDFYIYGANSKGKYSKTTPITVKANDTGFAVSSWGVYCLKSTGVAAGTGQTTTIVTDFKVSYPEAGESPLTGEGTKASPYLVKTGEDLRWIALKTLEKETFEGKYFRLGNDIDLSSFKAWTPIGGFDTNRYFNGVFDGNGHAIKNYSFDFRGLKYSGLFGYVGPKGSITNLTVNYGTIQSSGQYVGGLVGYTETGLTNCHGTGKIVSTGYEIGGLAGYSTSPISNCSFDGIIEGGNDCGGIVGYTTSPVTKCHANVDIRILTYIPNPTGTHSSGAIVGAAKGKNSSNIIDITDCYGSGLIYDSQRVQMLGGIAGAIYNCNILRSFSTARIICNAGKVSDGNSPAAGGIVGYVSLGYVKDCYNSGSVTGASCDGIGGIVGSFGGMSGAYHAIISCYNSGMVTSASTYEQCALNGHNSTIATAQAVYENSYYDCQTTGVEYDSRNPKTTAELTSGQPLEGFSTDVWVFTSGLYPRLKGLENTPEALLSASALYLDGNDNIRKVRKSFKVDTKNQIKWSGMDENNNLTTDTRALTFNGEDVTVKNVYGQEYVVATAPNGINKIYILRTIPTVFEGEGTAENPYLIKTVAEIETLSEAITKYQQNHKGDCFKLANDLDFSGSKFDGFGTDGTGAHYFGGTFDGAGHSIKNLVINKAGFDSEGKIDKSLSVDYCGLFGLLPEYATVKNIVIDKSCKFTFYRCSGALVGYVMGKVENCINNADVTGYGIYIGGIAGLASEDATIKNCINSGHIANYDNYLGGIAGDNSGLISSCQNTGVIEQKSDMKLGTPEKPQYAGGIAGNNFSRVDYSINSGNVKGFAKAGGITGRSAMTTANYSGGILVGNLSYGTVSGIENVGAVVGQMPSFELVENNCYDYKTETLGAVDGMDAKGIHALSTGELVSGNVPEQLKEAPFKFEKDAYPVIKEMAGDPSVTVAARCYILTSEQDNAGNLSEAATVKSAQGVKVSLAKGEAYKLADGKLSLNPGSEKNAEDEVVFSSGIFNKTIAISSMKVPFEGKGTAANPYLLRNAEDFETLAKSVNEDSVSYLDRCFRIAADIDFKDKTYTPVGNDAKKSFRGSLDGNGKSLSNIKAGAEDSKVNHIGVFGYMGSLSYVKDLTVKNSTFAGETYVGAIAGECAGIIENCSNPDVDVISASGYTGGFAGYMSAGSKGLKLVNRAVVNTTAKKYTGGIAGLCYADLQECGNEGEVIGSKDGYTGGIAGQYRGTAKDCYNNAELTSAAEASYMGGFAGSVERDTYITGFVNKGKITNGKGYLGGVTGSAVISRGSYSQDGLYIAACENHAEISGTYLNVGGLFGLIPAGSKVENCVNYGNIISSYGTLGGVFGEIRGEKNFTGTIKNIENHGTVKMTANKNYVGGIAGKIGDFVSLTNCRNYGDIDSKGYMVGGITGDLEGNLYSCFNSGTVVGATYSIGGIVGYKGDETDLAYCVNTGTVKTTGSYTGSYGRAGGIVGYGWGYVSYCSNFGAIETSDYAAGIMGTNFSSDPSVSNCYNAGKITVSDGAKNVGNIYAKAVEQGADNYYDSSVNGTLANDEATLAKGISKRELMDNPFTEGFVKVDHSYPIYKDNLEIGEMRWAAANYTLGANDTEQNVTTDISLASHPSLAWEVDNAQAGEIAGDKFMVKSAENQDFTLTVKNGKLAKSFAFHINKSVSGIEDISIDGTEGPTEYYDLRGVKIEKPEPGQVVICRRGTKATKVLVK